MCQSYVLRVEARAGTKVVSQKFITKIKFSIQQMLSVEIRFLPPSQTIILQKLKNEHFVLTLVGDGGIRIIEVGLHHTHLHHTRRKVTLLA